VQLTPQPLTVPKPPTEMTCRVSHDDAPSPPLSQATIAGAELIAGSPHDTGCAPPSGSASPDRGAAIDRGTFVAATLRANGSIRLAALCAKFR